VGKWPRQAVGKVDRLGEKSFAAQASKGLHYPAATRIARSRWLGLHAIAVLGWAHDDDRRDGHGHAQSIDFFRAEQSIDVHPIRSAAPIEGHGTDLSGTMT
jgi:hypothetical protein